MQLTHNVLWSNSNLKVLFLYVRLKWNEFLFYFYVIFVSKFDFIVRTRYVPDHLCKRGACARTFNHHSSTSKKYNVVKQDIYESWSIASNWHDLNHIRVRDNTVIVAVANLQWYACTPFLIQKKNEIPKNHHYLIVILIFHDKQWSLKWVGINVTKN